MDHPPFRRPGLETKKRLRINDFSHPAAALAVFSPDGVGFEKCCTGPFRPLQAPRWKKRGFFLAAIPFLRVTPVGSPGGS
ncbi:MAG TPA: hypothetical protein VMS17_00680 [Gemmataceae bacterium]|nr:hypothetical protein [Gemmataceae bacterium]